MQRVYKMPKSKRGAWRQYDAIVRRWYREMCGGTQFGIDWPTARINWPEDYAHIKAMQDAFASLPA